jgi:amino acid adenylation domain-containing protein/non-ribosomal peptide synthase protein (TIGR01720 family)
VAQKVEELSKECICIDKQWTMISNESTENLKLNHTTDQLAYLIYTSGSTGQPKGVMINHRSLLNLIFWHRKAYQLTEQDRTTLLAGVGFDASVWEIWPTLSAGACLIVPDEEIRVNPIALKEWLIQNEITISFLPTPLLESMLFLDWPKQVKLRKLLTGGDQLRYYRPVDFPVDVINHYGPTENTVVTTAVEVPKGAIHQQKPAIGYPISNTEVYVLDEYLQQVPIGVFGELYVGGAGLAQGYWNREDLTKERFISHPFQKDKKAKLYRTGDIVRFLPDGNLEFLGRMDHQVKIRGFRIELSEIETVLSQHPLIKETLVIPYTEDRTGEKQLVAYIVTSSGQEADWKAFVQSKLPNYMVPTAFIVLESFPLTPNGKIDRQALPTLKDISSQIYIAPQTTLEKEIVDIWSEVLGHKPIGLHDDFVSLGGHSLLAAQIMNRINQRYHLKLPTSMIFEASTVKQLSQVVKERHQDFKEYRSSLQKIERAHSHSFPMSFAQQRLWFLNRFIKNTATYHIPFLLQMKGRLNIMALRQSCDQLVERHESLRTLFKEIEGQTVQIIQNQISFGWIMKDFRMVNNPKEMAMNWIEQEAHAEFDLEQGPLLRISLLRIAEEEWLLLLNMHHIISDGWSMGVLLQELFQQYNAIIQGRKANLSDIPIQYVDYTIWQKKEKFHKQLAYWRQKLANVPVLELPTDHIRPSEQTYHGESYSINLPNRLVQGLKKMSQQEGTTLFMTLLAAFKVMLYRYTGQTDLAVGSPVAGRNHPELEKVIGFFVNTLVLRTQFSGNFRFKELLQQVRDVAIEAYDNQDIPFEQVVHNIQPERSLSHSPLFQVMFGFQDMPEVSESVAGLQVESLGLQQKTAKFDLTLMMYQKQEQLIATFEYSTDLFVESTIQRMAANFITLLEGILDHPECTISHLPLLSQQEQRQLKAWNDNRSMIPHICMHEWFEQQVKRTPDQIAIRSEKEDCSYLELNMRANQLAHYLQSLGVGPEVAVGICMQRSVDLIVGMLGILKAGGAYVPLDPAYPKDRIAYMVNDSQITVLLTEASLLSSLPLNNTRTVCIDRDWPLIDQHSNENGQCQIHPKNLAYMIYTSGSTGKPKGVMIEHHSAVALISWVQQEFVPEELQGVFAATSVCFDLSVFEIFVPLCCGGTVILAENALELPYLSARHQVTLVNTVPSAAKELLKMNGFPESVKVVNLAGEPLPLTLVQHLYQYGVQKVYNLYGPSEDTTYSTYAWIKADEKRSPVIGLPITNTQAYVLDAHLQQVPIGVPGELYLGGAGLARGYLNNPDLTAERFISVGVHDEPVKRVYKTGDLVRYRDDGNLEFLGRTDYQVKVRGFRIELGEIETHLRQHPEVQEVVVVVREDQPDEKKLVAYLVLKDEKEMSINDWRKYLKKRLPDYMIPVAFVILKQMPLTPNGKIDRKKLPAPKWNRSELGMRYQAPQTPLEKDLADIWCQVLNVDNVGVYDSFFALGGDSILSLQVIALANQKGIYLTPRHFFEYQSIAELAKVVAEEEIPIQAEQGVVTGDIFLTPIQHWFFEQSIPNRHNWNQSILMKLHSNIDFSLLQQAWSWVIQHHDTLRLRFAKEKHGFRQWNAAEEKGLVFHRIDGSSIPLSHRQQFLEQERKKAESGLHLETGPIIQAIAIDFGEVDTNYLIMVIHHLAVDGVSWRIILEDLERVYGQLKEGKQVTLLRKTTSYQEWAKLLRNYACSEKLKEERKFWQEQLIKATSSIPLDFPNQSERKKEVEQLTIDLTPIETQMLLKEAPNKLRAKVPEILLAALVQTFVKWTKRDSFLVNLESHGRELIDDRVDLTRTVGWFTSIYPVWIHLGRAKRLEQVLARVKEQLRQIPTNGLGYGVLRYLADSETIKQMRKLPEAKVSFNYLGQFDQLVDGSICFDQLVQFYGPSEEQESMRPHIIDVAALIRNGRLQMIWTYDQAYHRSITIRNLANDYVHWIQMLLHHQQAILTPADFSKAKVSQTELNKVLAKLAQKKKK